MVYKMDCKGLKSELEICKQWPVGAANKVTIICTTYNQESYVSDAIEGFLSQETNFPFEILIHDDASTDKTQNIIETYSKKYPNLIRVIIQNENQYSKGNIPFFYTIFDCDSEYIALCEGDDYWIDNKKLQYQVDALTKDETISLCFHSTMEFDVTKNIRKTINKHHSQSKVIDRTDVIRNRGGYISTASIVFRNKDLETLKSQCNEWPVGDYFLQSYLALIGNVYYVNRVSSVYRINSINSWNMSMKDLERKSEYRLNMIEAVKKFYSLVSDIEGSRYLIYPMMYYSFSYSYSKGFKLSAIKQFLVDIFCDKTFGKTKKMFIYFEYFYETIQSKISSLIRRF